MASEAEYLAMLNECALSPVIAVDTEGTELKTKKNSYIGTDYRDGTGFAYGISLACRVTDDTVLSLYFPLKHDADNVSPAVAAKLKTLIEIHQCVVYHNAKHDIVALATLGITRNTKYYCTLLMAHWIDENQVSKSLDAIAKLLLGEGKEMSSVFQNVLKIFGWTPAFPARIMATYAGADADRTLRIFERMIAEFKRQGFDGPKPLGT
jgi:DNA polymerase I-like protein with 3'-5' exonuclease and polymerase domains